MADTKLDVKVYPLNDPNNSTKAFANVTVADAVAIRGIRVIEGEKGLFVSMPQSKDKEGKYHDIAFPVNSELRKALNKAVVDEYKSAAKSLENGMKRAAEKVDAPREPSGDRERVSGGVLE